MSLFAIPMLCIDLLCLTDAILFFACCLWSLCAMEGMGWGGDWINDCIIYCDLLQCKVFAKASSMWYLE